MRFCDLSACLGVIRLAVAINFVNAFEWCLQDKGKLTKPFLSLVKETKNLMQVLG